MHHVALLTALLASTAHAAEIRFDPSVLTTNRCTDGGCTPYYPGSDAVGFFGPGSFLTDPTFAVCWWNAYDCNGQGQSVVILDAQTVTAVPDGRAVNTGLFQIRRNASTGVVTIPVVLDTRVTMDGVDHMVTFQTGVRFASSGRSVSLVDHTANIAQTFTHHGYTYDLTFLGFGDILQAGGAGAPFAISYFGSASTPADPVVFDRVLSTRVLYALERGDQVITVDAGLDQQATEAASITLSGAVGGAPASVAWTQTAGIPVAMAGSATLTPSFTAPLWPGGGSLTFELTAHGEDYSRADTVDVEVAPCLDLDGDGCDAAGLCFGDDSFGDADGDGLCGDQDFTLTRLDEVLPGQVVRFVAANAPPHRRVHLVASTAGVGDGPCFPGSDVCSDLLAPALIASGRADATGQVVFRPVAPLHVDELPDLWFQATWIDARTGSVTDGNDTEVLFVGCGDGTLRAFEACDDGNTFDADSCTSTCQIGACGIDNGGCDIHATCTPTGADTLECTCNEDEDWGGDGLSCIALSPDHDGDGFRADVDCDDDDERVFPGNRTFFFEPRSDGTWDFNCDGQDTLGVQGFPGYCNGFIHNATGLYQCFAEPGWVGGTPGCGESQTYLSACTGHAQTIQQCSRKYLEVEQMCR